MAIPLHTWLGALALGAVVASAPAAAQEPPAARQASWIAKDFRFHAGETLPELRIAYRTVGEPSGEPALLLHGTTGNGGQFMSPAFAGELFGPGQPLDVRRYFVILADSIGTGGSAKPSDGLRAQADALLDARLKAPFQGDANDHLWQWDASRDYDPSPLLGRVEAHVLAINSTDDERNPPELGVMERELAKVRHARMLWVQGGPDTAGHGTTAQARWWKAECVKWLETVPRGGR